ncbi:Protoporphyrinogen oxidase [Bibersteinia trehalosi USDA-ARS-USMARC-188]|uniref:Protoporphyrinogen IX dehydrogenase [quinone] n=5 Tax=Bibersteinia trehalosi TaxID=47735 RepID=W0RDD5_BIBTR|nr:menaquinone-dependent protoporphyrinogen IX dehydrogenase [Bibersteinia trehalosi]AGH39393.1 Protoporphyrinogen oxidase [Bibersteinia trehalosi USDA-ARS-USMARC-192]AHG80861.1 Protoporphyrinogen oxidase [Bibersteinia trehalosi USDA-ARS-USMARC-188]AHG83011.1 Protoporphyrinogen oxidase [Bibersteinia trehalosi USDA-ARS-USMARC-189]AHG87398.1 Protoporphyrinogen oxidase [Bibersteinia trehalosi USDA-ARS-USMARC-190]OAQ14094.1 protoporphyrinogen oxidase [Bibersteinia trehalosi Y31]
MKTAILYLTRDGQTKKIAERMASQIPDCQLISLRDQAVVSATNFANFDQIIIGASIRYGHFDPLLEKFIAQHYALLNTKKSAFFSVNLTARKANRNTPQTNVYTRKLLARIAWQPSLVEVFAGALFYPRYNWFDRTMIRFIMRITKGDTDISREYEYTDWQKVDLFVKRFVN